MWLDVETWLPLLIVGLTVAIYFVAEVENVRVSRVTAVRRQNLLLPHRICGWPDLPLERKRFL
jgi:hypothetical protein